MMGFEGVIALSYHNSSKYSIIFNSGILVTIEKVENLLQMMLLVPPLFKGGYNLRLCFCTFLFFCFSQDLENISMYTNITSCRFKAAKLQSIQSNRSY